MSKPKVAFFDFTSCEGCQLAILNLEVELLELFSRVKVLALTLSHEGMNSDEIEQVVAQYEAQYGIPVCDVLVHGCEKIIKALLERFPELRANSHK